MLGTVVLWSPLTRENRIYRAGSQSSGQGPEERGLGGFHCYGSGLYHNSPKFRKACCCGQRRPAHPVRSPGMHIQDLCCLLSRDSHPCSCKDIP